MAVRVGTSVAGINGARRTLDLKPGLLAVVQTCDHASNSVLIGMAKETDPARRQRSGVGFESAK